MESLASVDETPCALTARRQSPEYNPIILLDSTVTAAVVAVLLDGTVALTPLATALRSMLLIRRQSAPDQQLWPVFRLALLYLTAEFGLPTRLVAQPDVVDLLGRTNQRIFYLLTLYLVDLVARREIIEPWKRIDGFEDRVEQVRAALPRMVVELDCDGQISPQTNSAINGVNYVRMFRSRHTLSDDRKARSRVPASQALFVRCCGRLALCAPVHPRTDSLLCAMRKWTLRERTHADVTFGEFFVRYICLGCMQADAPIVFDPRGVVFCMDCGHSNAVWVNPLHLILETVGGVARVPRRSGPHSCVVGPHTLRSSETSFPVLGGQVVCEEHARSHGWLRQVDPALTPLVRRLLSTKQRTTATYARSAPRYAPIRI